LACVLVVEDDPWIQWMIADDLVDRGYEVVTAQDGLEAMKCLAEVRPDVIVLDLMLPRSSGWAFAEQYQTVTDGDVIPIVVVSAAPDPTLTPGSRSIQRCLAKPFDIQELARAVAELAGSEPATAPVLG
jgi:CheY-like chemotaxis protein